MNRRPIFTIFIPLVVSILAVAFLMVGMGNRLPVARAQVDLPTLNTPYNQNFDTLQVITGTYPFTNNSTIVGWYSNRASYMANNGNSNTGALYSFGSDGSSDRALGSIASGTTGEIRYGVRLRNTTGVTITALEVSYTGEQWRQGGNTAQQALSFTYQISPTFFNITDGIWIDFPALYFWSPITNSGAITGPLNGNDPANRRQLSATLAVIVPPGDEIMLRWVDINDAGNDHGLAVDDLSVVPRCNMPVLRLSKEVTPLTSVEYHGTVTYTVVLENIGGADDPDVLFTDTLPAEVDFGGWVEQPAGATVSNDQIIWGDALTAGTAITFTFTAQHVGNYGDVVTNTAEFRGTSGGGTAQAVFTVEALIQDVTFVYHDLEDAVSSGEDIRLCGEFNGWCVGVPITMTADSEYAVFTATVPGLEVGQSYAYKYYVVSDALPENSRWDMLNTGNRVITVTSGLVRVDDYRNVVVGWANLQWPHTLQTDVNHPTDHVYGQVYIQNVTDPSGAGRGIRAEVGYGTDADPTNWTWFPMTFHKQVWNNDEFVGVMTPTAGGVFSYATRFDGNWGPGNPNAGWTYGDTDGSPPFDLDKTGVLTSVIYDVAVSKTASGDPVVVRGGESARVTYTLVIENRSTITPVAPITLTDILPDGFVYGEDDSGVPLSGSGSATDPLVWVFTSTLAPGSSLSFHLVVSATDSITATGRYTNTATVAVEGGDWAPDNDIAQAGVMVYRVVPIANARAGSTGTVFAVEGQVIYVPGTYNPLEWGVQDASGGIAVYYSPAPNVSLGDYVRVVATRGAYNNQEQLQSPVLHFVNLWSGPEVAPKPYATGVISTGTTEGWLVQVAGYVSGLGACTSNYFFLVNDGTGPAYIFVDQDTGVNVCSMGITNTDYVRVVGFSTQYQNLYEIKPRRPADIQELYPTTFVYHDLEDAVHSGEAVYLAGSFNGWNSTATPMSANDDFSVFSVTVTLPNSGTYEYKYVVYTDTVPSGPANWNWLQSQNRSVNVTAPTTVNDYRNIQPGYVVLQWPPAVTTTVGIPTENIYGQIWADDLTSREGPPRAVLAQVGYGTDADPANWTTWSPMVWNTQSGNNDEFMGTITPTAAGVYSYVVRFNGNWGPGNPNAGWTYGDTDGVHPSDPFEIENAGVLTVLAPSLNITKSVEPQADVLPGSVVTYTVVLSNGGAGDAIGVVLTDALPAEVTFGGWVQQGGAVYESGVITWTGGLTGGAEVRLVFTATLGTDPGLYNRTITNTASYRSDNAGSGSAQASFATARRYYIYAPVVMRNWRP